MGPFHFWENDYLNISKTLDTQRFLRNPNFPKNIDAQYHHVVGERFLFYEGQKRVSCGARAPGTLLHGERA